MNKAFLVVWIMLSCCSDSKSQTNGTLVESNSFSLPQLQLRLPALQSSESIQSCCNQRREGIGIGASASNPARVDSCVNHEYGPLHQHAEPSRKRDFLWHVSVSSAGSWWFSNQARPRGPESSSAPGRCHF